MKGDGEDMIDFRKSLSEEQIEKAENKRKEEKRRTVRTIIAYDEKGNQFEKKGILDEKYNNISFGWPVEYNLDDLLKDFDGTKDMCIDIGGRNHRDSPVCFRAKEFKEFLTKASSLKERLNKEKNNEIHNNS